MASSPHHGDPWQSRCTSPGLQVRPMFSLQSRAQNLKGTLQILSRRCQRSYGVTASTLDSESSDRGSNPRGTFSTNPLVDAVGADDAIPGATRTPISHLFGLACDVFQIFSSSLFQFFALHCAGQWAPGAHGDTHAAVDLAATERRARAKDNAAKHLQHRPDQTRKRTALRGERSARRCDVKKCTHRKRS